MQELMGFQAGALIDGRYRILRCLGIGAMGSVLLVEDSELRAEQVALKLLHPHLSMNDEGVERFRNEVVLARRLIHPNIVRVYEFGKSSNNQLYISMEYVDGIALSELLDPQSPPLEFPDALSLLLQISAALAHAHEKGLLHRDIKPSNILLTKEGIIKLSDFGTARAVGGGHNLTQTGECVGTPFYMSPEQLRGESADYRSDVYSFGITAYELLTGRKPFVDDSYYKLVLKHSSQPLPAIREQREDIPEWFVEFINRCTAKDPESRFETMVAVQDCLQRSVESEQVEVNTHAAQLLLSQKLAQETKTLRTRRRLRRRRIVLLACLCIAIAIPIVRKISGAHPQLSMRLAYFAFSVEPYAPESLLMPLRYLLRVQFSRDTVALTDNIIEGRRREMSRYMAIAQIRAGAKLDKPDIRGFTPMLLAAEVGDRRLVDEMLAAGASVHERTPDGRGMLHLVNDVAARKIVSRAILNGVDPFVQDSDGFTALHHYAVLQEEGLVSEFAKCIRFYDCKSGLERPQWRDKLRELANMQDTRGRNPLHHALATIHQELVDLNVLAPEERRLALVNFERRQRGNLTVIQRLARYGSRLDTPDTSQRTALDYLDLIERESNEYPIGKGVVQQIRASLSRH